MVVESSYPTSASVVSAVTQRLNRMVFPACRLHRVNLGLGRDRTSPHLMRPPRQTATLSLPDLV